MYYVDTHIHLQDYNPADIKNVVTNAKKNYVNAFVNASAHPNDWETVLNLANEDSVIIPALGIHPWHIDDISDSWDTILEYYLNENPRLWVGECGIDRLKNPNITKQLNIFNTCVKLANKYNRPLIVHSVKADEILKPLLKDLPKRTIFHSFTGSLEWGKFLQNHGFYLGLNFSILRKKNYEQILAGLNPKLLLLETDGPYQSGQKNTLSYPQNLPNLATQIAPIYNLNTADFAKLLYQNWLTFTGEITPC